VATAWPSPERSVSEGDPLRPLRAGSDRPALVPGPGPCSTLKRRERQLDQGGGSGAASAVWANAVQIVVLAAVVVLVRAIGWELTLAVAGAVIVLAGIALFVYMIVVDEWFHRRRIAALAARRGWTYQAYDFTLAERVPPQLGHGFDSFGKDILVGRVGRTSFRSFIFSYHTEPMNETDHSTDVHLRVCWIVLIEGLPVSMPTIRCRPRYSFDDSMPGFQTGDAAFDRSSVMEGPHDLLREVFGERMRGLMSDLVVPEWQIEAGVLAARRRQTQRPDLDVLPSIVEALRAIAEAIPEATARAT
jgi:hypothetical protein